MSMLQSQYNHATFGHLSNHTFRQKIMDRFLHVKKYIGFNQTIKWLNTNYSFAAMSVKAFELNDSGLQTITDKIRNVLVH